MQHLSDVDPQKKIERVKIAIPTIVPKKNIKHNVGRDVFGTHVDHRAYLVRDLPIFGYGVSPVFHQRPHHRGGFEEQEARALVSL